MVQRLRICLAMQRTQVRFQVRKLRSHVPHSEWAHASQLEGPHTAMKTPPATAETGWNQMNFFVKALSNSNSAILFYRSLSYRALWCGCVCEQCLLQGITHTTCDLCASQWGDTAKETWRTRWGWRWPRTRTLPGIGCLALPPDHGGPPWEGGDGLSFSCLH